MTQDLIARLRAVREEGPLSDLDYDRLEAANLIERQARALAPFAKVMADIITNREDDEVIDGSLAADRITWGDLRAALQAMEGM